MEVKKRHRQLAGAYVQSRSLAEDRFSPRTRERSAYSRACGEEGARQSSETSRVNCVGPLQTFIRLFSGMQYIDYQTESDWQKKLSEVQEKRRSAAESAETHTHCLSAWKDILRHLVPNDRIVHTCDQAQMIYYKVFIA